MIETKFEVFNKSTQVWETIEHVFPLDFVTRLNQELDSGEVAFFSDEHIFPPFQMCRLTINEEQFYFYGNDTAQWIAPPCSKLKHKISLVEPTKELEGVLIDGRAIVQPITGEQQTLLDILEDLLSVTPLRLSGQEQPYVLTSETRIKEKLQGRVSPEFRWGSQTTLWECLLDIGACIDAIPRLTYNEIKTAYNTITFDFVNEKITALEDFDYNGILESFDEAQYCTAIESYVENLVAGNQSEGSIVFPAPDGFITPRTSEDVRITAQNCQIILPNNAAEILHLWVDGTQINLPYEGISGPNIGQSELFTAAEVGVPAVDISKYLVDTQEWQTLNTQIVPSPAIAGIEEKTKINTLRWTRYGNIIEITNTENKGILFQTTGVFEMAIYSVLQYDSEQFPVHYTKDGTTYALQAPNAMNYTPEQPLDDPRNFNFRVEFLPLNVAGKIRTVKDVAESIDFVQPFNQRAEINDATAFGRNMKSTVSRLGRQILTVVSNINDWSKAAKIGDTFVYNGRDYIVTAAEYQILSAMQCTCIYTLSDEWSYLSQFVEINKGFRSWNIPSNILERNLYYSDYLEISDTAENNTSSFDEYGIGLFAEILQAPSSELSEVNNMWVRNGSYGAVLSVASFGFGNSLVFNARTQDNLSAGKRISSEDSQYCVDVYYCDEDGTLPDATLVFSTEIEQLDENALPWVHYASIIPFRTNTYDYYNYVVRLSGAQIKKTSAEQLGFIYQLHFVTKNSDIIIGDALGSANPLARQYSGTKSFQFWGLTKKLPNGTGVMISYFGEKIADSSGTDYFSCVVEGESIKLTVNALADNYVGWAICTDSGEIIIAENQPLQQQRTLYFNFKHYR